MTTRIGFVPSIGTVLGILAAVLLLLPAAGIDALAQSQQLQFQRPRSQAGISQFETSKSDTLQYNGFTVDWGAGFTQQFQGLTHENDAAPRLGEDGQNLNALNEIGNGLNLATANLYLGAQLADGISVNLTTYLSSRHHPEAWVKGGYLQVDKLGFFNSDAISSIMDYVTVKVGHFEINYGDAHFRRTDNGNAMYNPFVGNFIMDSFTTEIGGEVYVQSSGFLAMAAVTGGEIRGSVDRPDDRAPSFYGKLGYDSEVAPDVRLRLTGSAYTTAKSLNNTLHFGDRAGSRYYSVIGGGDWSGRVSPGFRDEVTAFMINPFIQVKGLEVFGLAEFVSGRAHQETSDRSVQQYGVEALYRFLNDALYVGGRYNVLSGEILSMVPDDAPSEQSVSRIQIGGGWFVTDNVMVKGEYVIQSYDDYPTDSIFHDGQFDGFMLEGVVVF